MTRFGYNIVLLACLFVLLIISYIYFQKHDFSVLRNAQSSGKDGVRGNVESDLSSLEITEWWEASSLLKWDWEKDVEYECKRAKLAGNKKVCMDERYGLKKPCLVYSFGINNDWSFDDYMGDLGCEVHSFDPSIGQEDFNRSRMIQFHNMGISGQDDDSFTPQRDIYVKEEQHWKIRRLNTIRKMLGHTNRVLDIVKIDVETHEWPILIDLVSSGDLPDIKQLLVEWHLFTHYPAKHHYISFYRAYRELKRAGFRTFWRNFVVIHFEESKWRLQADVHYVNTKFAS